MEIVRLRQRRAPRGPAIEQRRDMDDSAAMCVRSLDQQRRQRDEEEQQEEEIDRALAAALQRKQHRRVRLELQGTKRRSLTREKQQKEKSG